MLYNLMLRWHMVVGADAMFLDVEMVVGRCSDVMYLDVEMAYYRWC